MVIAAVCLTGLGAGVAYAGGVIDLPKICDPADTLTELSGQWGAKVLTEDCLEAGARQGVVVRDNDYAFEREDCVVFLTRSSAAIQIAFRREDDLVILTEASPKDEIETSADCGPIRVQMVGNERVSHVS